VARQTTEQAQGFDSKSSATCPICTHCNRTFEPHPLSERRCALCFLNSIEQLYFEYVYPLIKEGVYSEEQHLTREQIIQGLACRIVVYRSIEDSVKWFNEASNDRLEWARDSKGPGITFEQNTSNQIRQAAQLKQTARDKRSSDRLIPRYSTIEDFVRIMHLAIAQRRLWRRFLYRRFRYDPVARVWLAGPPASIKVTDHLCWMMALSFYDSYNADFILGATCAVVQINRGNNLKTNIAEVLTDICQWRADESFYTTIGRLNSSSRVDQEIALAQLTGLVKAAWKGFPHWQKVSNRLSNSELAAIVFVSWLELRQDKREPIDPEAVVKGLVRKISSELEEEELLEEHHQRIAYQQQYREEKRYKDPTAIEGNDSNLKNAYPPSQSEEVSDPKWAEFERFIEVNDLIKRARLNQNELDVLALRLEDLSYQGIADYLNRSLASVKFDLHQARQKLKKLARK
jgi:hypothetical protein